MTMGRQKETDFVVFLLNVHMLFIFILPGTCRYIHACQHLQFWVYLYTCVLCTLINGQQETANSQREKIKENTDKKNKECNYSGKIKLLKKKVLSFTANNNIIMAFTSASKYNIWNKIYTLEININSMNIWSSRSIRSTLQN